MAVYQVAIIFEVESDEIATKIAQAVADNFAEDPEMNAKIAFTKFEQEEQEVADV